MIRDLFQGLKYREKTINAGLNRSSDGKDEIVEEQRYGMGGLRTEGCGMVTGRPVCKRQRSEVCHQEAKRWISVTHSGSVE